MINLSLIGIGTGNPNHVTMEAIKAMNAADLILIPLKGDDKADLAGLRMAICRACVRRRSNVLLHGGLHAGNLRGHLALYD